MNLEPGLYDYLRSAARNWWLILLTAAVCAGGAAALAARGDVEYRSIASIAIAPIAPVGDVGEPVLYSLREGLTVTLAELIPTASFRRDAADAAHIEEAELASLDVTALVVPQSLVVIVSVTGDRPELVTAFNAALVDRSAERFEKLYPSTVVTPLDAPGQAEAVDNSPRRAAVLAGTLGLGVGFLLGLVRDAIARVRWSRPLRT